MTNKIILSKTFLLDGIIIWVDTKFRILSNPKIGNTVVRNMETKKVYSFTKSEMLEYFNIK